MLFTPFPRPSLKTYSLIGLIIGVSISFILIVFQPFGTDQFTHPNKTLILLGYGTVSTVAVTIYYVISIYIVNKRLESKWNILYEAMDLFLCLILSMLATYLYFCLVFDVGLSMSGMMGFLSVAVAVSFLPTLGVFIYLFKEYRGVIRSIMTISKDSVDHPKITLQGTNKKESLTLDLESLRYIKSDDNYVIIYLFDGEKEQRHMIRSTLKLMLEQLDHKMFYQGHRSYIINLNSVVGLEGNKNSAKVLLSDTSKSVPVSRSQYDHIRSMVS